MTKEPVKNKKEIEACLARMVGCILKAGSLTSKAAVVDIEDGKRVVLNTDRRPRVGRSIWIEFVDNLKQRHGFTVQTVAHLPDGIAVSYPPIIYRVNLREFWRVEAPMGSKFVMQWNSESLSGEMLNISAGGVAFHAEPFSDRIDLPLKGVELELVAPEDNSRESVRVPSCKLRRFDAGPKKLRLYGVVFDYTHDLQNRLMRYVRDCERQFLRLRSQGMVVDGSAKASKGA
ncbi:MAG: PilZ domain-containing protein [Pseudomonadota bacterium]